MPLIQSSKKSLKDKIHIIIEGTDTPAGKLFDVLILVAIITSVLVVMLDSVLYLRLQYGRLFFIAEWFFTLLFTVEYALRLYSAPNRRRYATSFFGVVDLLALLPTYLSLFFVGTHYLLVVRILRILRIFGYFDSSLICSRRGFWWQPLKPVSIKLRYFSYPCYYW